METTTIDYRDRIMTALEDRVRFAERLAAMAGEWRLYDLAYAAYSAFYCAQDPTAAVREILAAMPEDTDPRDREALTHYASEVERTMTDASRGPRVGWGRG